MKRVVVDSIYLDARGKYHVSMVMKDGTRHCQIKKSFIDLQEYNAYFNQLSRAWTIEY